MEYTKALAGNFVKTRYNDLPEEVIEATKRSILDILGVMLPPTTLDSACIALNELIKEAGGKKESTVIGFGGKVPCWMAAFINGSLCHAIDYDDTTDEPGHHPTACTFPAALAIAERVGRISGKDFIIAVALGNDLGVRLASAPMGNLITDYPWFSITTFGVFAATATAGKLLGLSEEKMTNALGLALHRVAGVTEAVVEPHSNIRAIRDGFTNKCGVLSALMAEKGISGCEDSIEKLYDIFYRNQYEPKALVSDLGKRFRGAEASLKPWPCCRVTHGNVHATLEILGNHGIHPEQVEEVTLIVGEYAGRHLCEPAQVKQNPKSSIAAKFSLPFVIGVALTKGSIRIADFLPQNLEDPEVLRMAKRIRYRINPEFGALTPTETEIRTKDGATFSMRVDTIRGHPKNPLAKSELIAKFEDCADYAKKPFSSAQKQQLISRILELEKVRDMRDITSLLG